MISDEKIINGCLSGKRRAYSMLYKKYAQPMLGLCMRYCRSLSEAEDVLQEGFIKIYKNIGNFKHKGSFEGWIKRIMINTAIDNYQSSLKDAFHMSIESMEESMIHEENNQEFPAFRESGISREKLMTLIQNLPEGYRMVFNMYAIDGFSHKDIAKELGISESTSKTQLLKARKKLKAEVNDLLYKIENHNYIKHG